MIERQLHALLPGIVDVGESEHVPCDLTGGVVAAILARGVDARNAQCLDPLGLSRLTTARDIQEIAIQIARDPASQLLAVELQRARETGDLVRRERELPGIHPYRIDRRAHGEGLAVSIRDRAAMRGDYRSA